MRATQKARLLRGQNNIEMQSVDAEPVSVTEQRTAQFFTLSNVGTSAMVIVCIVLLLILHLRRPPAPLPAPCPEAVMAADNVTCGQSTDCQQGFRDATNSTCEYHNRPSNTTCRLTCAAPGEEGMCDARGQCIGNASQCPGVCEDRDDCEHNFFNEDIVWSYDPETEWTYASWYSTDQCYFRTCLWTVLDIYVTSSKFPVKTDGNLSEGWWPGASRFQCTDYIAPAILASNPGCFQYERYLLSPHLIRYNEYGNNFGTGDYGNETFPFQVSFCSITYKCSRPDPLDELSASSDNAVHMRSLSQRGLSLIASSNTVPLGVSDPLLRNLMYDKFEEIIRTSLPDFLDRVFANVTIVPSPSPMTN